MPTFKMRDFTLAGGDVLPELDVAYEIYGAMNRDASNVVLVAHGITITHVAAGAPTADSRRGWFNAIIGPGKLLDTDRYCVVSPNMLGSCYGSTGPASTNPATGRPYGAAFPPIAPEDIVRSQRLMLESLGVTRLVAVVGQSFGGYIAFQWAVTAPDFMAGIIALDTAPKDIFDSGAAIPALVARLAAHPNWNGGDHYATGGLEDLLTEMRIETLKGYGIEEQLGDIADPEERAAVLEATARDWAREYDPNSMIAIQRAFANYDVEGAFGDIRAKLLYILTDTDEHYPASMAPGVMAKLRAAGVDATYHEVKSRHGHYATTMEPEKWAPEATAFLDNLGATNASE